MTTRVTSDHILFWQKSRVMANDSGGHLPIAYYQPQGLSPAGYFTDEQRRYARWIGALKCEVIFERAQSMSNVLGVCGNNGRPVEAKGVQ